MIAVSRSSGLLRQLYFCILCVVSMRHSVNTDIVWTLDNLHVYQRDVRGRNTRMHIFAWNGLREMPVGRLYAKILR